MVAIKNNGPIIEGETSFRRKRPKDRKKVHEGGNLHLERIYATGGMVASVFHNYITNAEEIKYDSVETALEKVKYMKEMQEDTPEWVDDGIIPAILKALACAQRQNSEKRGIIMSVDDPSSMDIEEECGEIGAMIAEARRNDPELDEEMTRAEMKMSKSKRK